MMRWIVVLMAAVLFALPAAACSKESKKKKAEDPLKVDPAERDRGLRACKAYAERVCRCAKTNKTNENNETNKTYNAFKKLCDEAETHKTSLQMVIDTIASDQVDNRERVMLIKGARRTIETCFAAPTKLDERACPVAPRKRSSD